MSDKKHPSSVDELVAQIDTGARNPMGWQQGLSQCCVLAGHSTKFILPLNCLFG